MQAARKSRGEISTTTLSSQLPTTAWFGAQYPSSWQYALLQKVQSASEAQGS
jgi:hypothetical protein